MKRKRQENEDTPTRKRTKIEQTESSVPVLKLHSKTGPVTDHIICVRKSNGHQFPIKVNLEDTISMIKAKISDKDGIATHDQILYLNDGRRLYTGIVHDYYR
eukprot:TRINITY_DN9989_c0_g1_i1.p1 TRINITY_DN9989_c0_g1~~TRINITY_DN9989_c0_g1_i1.p1  ORF type:complete len:102 (-),score=13.17 TRINITY_DN9989_c0_g1_i1:277-582(-)